MTGYSALAKYYDAFTANIDYAALGGKYLRLLRKHRAAGGMLLDLGCGTGSLSLFFAERGDDVTGVDISEDMLARAHEKAAKAGLDILFLRQDMRRLDLYGTYDAAVCGLDGINHLIRKKDLERAFLKTALFLNPGGVFLFDINTELKFIEDFGQNTFVLEGEGVFCAWQNSYSPRTRLNTSCFTLFERQEDGGYRRYDDRVTERAYGTGELCAVLETSGFRVTGIYGGGAGKPPAPDDKRIFIAARKL